MAGGSGSAVTVDSGAGVTVGSGTGVGLGAAGLALGTAAVVRDIVAPRTVVYSSYGSPVYTTYPSTYVAPAVYPAPVVTYPAPVVVPRW